MMKGALYITIILLLGSIAWIIGRLTVNDIQPEIVKQETQKVPSEGIRPKPEKTLPVRRLTDRAHPDNYPMPDVSPINLVTTALDYSQTENVRMKALWDLRNQKLSEYDEKAIRSFLADSKPQRDFSVKNDALEIIARNGQNYQENGLLLTELMVDKSQSPVLRDYVIQIIHEFITRRWSGEFKDFDLESKNAMIKAIWDQTDDKVETIAGTSLVTLVELSKKHNEVLLSDVLSKASEIIASNEFTDGSKMGAVQVLALSKDRKHAELVLNQFLEGTGSIVYRISCLHTAAKLNQGKSELHRELLKISKDFSTDKRLRRAAQMNLNLISQN